MEKAQATEPLDNAPDWENNSVSAINDLHNSNIVKQNILIHQMVDTEVIPKINLHQSVCKRSNW